tara:strand:+ start:93 stop:830 length:738 start_codon:yes stop_codon:yes gene_type:complete
MHNIDTKAFTFPSLCLQDFEEHDTPLGPANVYKLNWAPLEKERRQHFDSWWKRHGEAATPGPSSTTWTCLVECQGKTEPQTAERERAEGVDEYGQVPTKYDVALPEAYDAEIKNALFLLDTEYKREIEHHTRHALLDWTQGRRFDTAVRDTCLAPAVKHVEVAFYLLSDCLFDPDTQKRMSFERALFYYWKQAALVKLWHRQTGSGLIWRNAGMHRLDKTTKNKMSPAKESVCAFVKALRAHMDR